MRTLSRTARPGDGPVTRAALRAGDAILVLAAVQLVLTVVLVGPYIDWFLEAHGYDTRGAAPDGEALGVCLALGLRCVFSLAWVTSYARLCELVTPRNGSSYRLLVAYAAVAVLGYAWLVRSGGPWWVEGVRALQLALGVGMLCALVVPGVRRRLGGQPASGATG